MMMAGERRGRWDGAELKRSAALLLFFVRPLARYYVFVRQSASRDSFVDVRRGAVVW